MNTTSKKQQYLKELKEIQAMSNKLRGINESIMFEDEYDDIENQEMIDAQSRQEQPAMQQPEQEQEIETGMEGQTDIKDVDPEEQGMEELDKMGELDQIRKITLKGMLKFANNPEHPQFQALQKIFQLCNKGVEKENQQQAQ